MNVNSQSLPLSESSDKGKRLFREEAAAKGCFPMIKKIRLLLTTLIAILFILFLAAPHTFAQKPAKSKFQHAIDRSEDAGRIITLLSVVPDSGFPKELIDKAEAVGVFPKVTKAAALFSQTTQGYGVIGTRGENGWTLPAFYLFSGSGYGNVFAKNETFAIILLFMTKDAVAAFEKGGFKLKGERKALEGPVGVITDEQRKELEGAHILAYTYFNGKLKGTTFGKSFWKSFLLNPDNNINTPLYGMKGREVLAGKKVDTTMLPAGINAYQEALQKYYPATR
jgi:lipid-binding SYLF domain-containing protein